jgi:hypothetical protein
MQRHAELPELQECRTVFVPLSEGQLEFSNRFIVAPLQDDPDFDAALERFGLSPFEAMNAPVKDRVTEVMAELGRGLGFYRAHERGQAGPQAYAETSKGRVLVQLVERHLKRDGRRVMLYTSLQGACGLEALRNLAVARGWKFITAARAEDLALVKSHFNAEGSEYQVLIVCGMPEGFDVSRTEVVIFAEAPHDQALREQVVARARRLSTTTRRVRVYELVSTVSGDGDRQRSLRSAIDKIPISAVLLGSVAVWTAFSRVAQPTLARLSGASEMPPEEYRALKERLKAAAKNSPHGNPAFLQGTVDLVSLVVENRSSQIFARFFRGPVLVPAMLLFYAFGALKLLLWLSASRRNFQIWLHKGARLSDVDATNFATQHPRGGDYNPFEASTPDFAVYQKRRAQAGRMRRFYEELSKVPADDEAVRDCEDEERRACHLVSEAPPPSSQGGSSRRPCFGYDASFSEHLRTQRQLTPEQRQLVRRLTNLRCDKASQGCIVAMFMGTGKTFAAISVLLNNRAFLSNGVVVACPAYLKKNWEDELQQARFRESDMTVQFFSYGDDPPDVILDDQAVVLDECHHATGKWLAFLSHARLRLALSGTPAKDVHALLQLLNAVHPPPAAAAAADQGVVRTRNFRTKRYVVPAARGALLAVKRFLHFLAPPFLLVLPALDFFAGNNPAVLAAGLATYVGSIVLSLRNWEVDLNEWDYRLLAQDAAPWIYHVGNTRVVPDDDCAEDVATETQGLLAPALGTE